MINLPRFTCISVGSQKYKDISQTNNMIKISFLLPILKFNLSAKVFHGAEQLPILLLKLKQLLHHCKHHMVQLVKIPLNSAKLLLPLTQKSEIITMCVHKYFLFFDFLLCICTSVSSRHLTHFLFLSISSSYPP